MDLSPDQGAVLGIFKEHDIEQGEYLSAQTVDRARLDLPEEVQANWDATIKQLIREGYIFYDRVGYGLSGKGHRQIHANSPP